MVIWGVTSQHPCCNTCRTLCPEPWRGCAPCGPFTWRLQLLEEWSQPRGAVSRSLGFYHCSQLFPKHTRPCPGCCCAIGSHTRHSVHGAAGFLPLSQTPESPGTVASGGFFSPRAEFVRQGASQKRSLSNGERKRRAVVNRSHTSSVSQFFITVGTHIQQRLLSS